MKTTGSKVVPHIHSLRGRHSSPVLKAFHHFSPLQKAFSLDHCQPPTTLIRYYHPSALPHYIATRLAVVKQLLLLFTILFFSPPPLILYFHPICKYLHNRRKDGRQANKSISGRSPFFSRSTLV